MPRLQDPLSLGPLRLANRLVMAPMVTAMAEDHHVSDAHLAWYGERASGLGLVIVECAAIAPEGTLVPRQLGAWDDAFVPGLKRLADAIHATGTPAVLQLVHGGARAHVEPDGPARLGASELRIAAGAPPRALSAGEIQTLVAAFAAAARRAQEAGMDGVEIHAAHGYLLSQFLMPRVNTRTDGYGGALAGRARFLLEVVRATRAAVGPDYPVLVRMHATERLEGGLTEEDSATLAGWLEAEGVAALDLSGIGQSSQPKDALGPYLATSSVGGRGWTPGAYAEAAGRVKAATGLPIITVGRMAEEGAASRTLERGQADLIALGRQLLIDPQAAQKLLEGREAELLRCEECMACFLSIRKGPVACSRWT